MLRGSAQATVDDKGRLKIPTDFRRQLEERWGSELFITSLDGNSAFLYPLPVWEEIETKLLAMPSTHPVRERYLERVNFFGLQARTDPQGRVLMPPILREAAQMSGEVVVGGRINHLEVWNRERFAKKLAAEPFSAEDKQALAEYGI
jgi:MraZ protein